MLTRALAVLCALLLFNQSAFAIARECRSDAAPARQHEGGHSHHAPVQGPTQSHDAHAKCCDALSSCGQTLAPQSASGIAINQIDATVTIAPPRALLSSAPIAPEPPPPRA